MIHPTTKLIKWEEVAVIHSEETSQLFTSKYVGDGACVLLMGLSNVSMLNDCSAFSLTHTHTDAGSAGSLSDTLSLSALGTFPGNTMTVSYMTGLMVGSTVAYAAYSFTAPGQEARLPTPMPVNGTGY